MRYLFLLLYVSCGSLHQDTAPAPIKVGQKRVETMICGSHEVGENGCLFKDGVITEPLKIYKVYSGSVEIMGCGIDQNLVYDNKGEWLDVPLPKQITNDCVLTITQRITWKGSDHVKFPIEAALGTVTLGICHSNVHCDLQFEQKPISRAVAPFVFEGENSGVYALSGCGRSLIPPTPVIGDLSLQLGSYLPGYIGSGCMFILGVSGKELHKVYRKVWQYSDSAIALKIPAFDGRCFIGDPQTMAVSVNGKVNTKPDGCFTPTSTGDYLRFYTSQGRSLIVFIKNGAIVWTK